MQFFYSGYIIRKDDGKQVATSNGIVEYPSPYKLGEAITETMLSHYDGPLPVHMLTVHIISLNKVG